MGGEMEVLLDELAVGPVNNILHRAELRLVLIPTTGCPPDSYLNAEMASRGREGRA